MKSFANALEEKGVSVDRFFFDGSHHLKHQYQFHLNKPESKENIQKVLSFLSRNTTGTQVGPDNKDTDHTEINLNPYDN
ncbi:lipase [Staphylococcus schleiferi]|uniref:Lipase n=1 Tax=Staphylococcus schleiferi TaxID=1295 RepID=A0A7Z7VY28_STASC|nr:lipase [Staphylococcus schleiferi]SUM90131.1 lipase [Staphylococcus schleiferi]